jgi:hypothetical protein
MRYDGTTYTLTGIDSNVRYSTDGVAWSAYDVSGDVGAVTLVKDIAYNNNNLGSKSWVAVCSPSSVGIVRVPTSISGTYVDKTGSQTFDALNNIHYDIVGEHYIIPTWNSTVVSDDDGLTWREQSFESNYRTDNYPVSNIDWSGQLMAFINDGGTQDNTSFTHILIDRNYITHYDVDKFLPLHINYRAQTFGVLDGYVVLIGVREWDNSGKTWDYNPKRIRWSVPGSYSDFSGTGSGTADAAGPGEFLASSVVNGRIVVFETTRVSAIVPRGDTDDPWDFDVIKDNFKIFSNPVAVNDVCYVIGSDGLLWQSDGIDVTEVGASFDLTKFDDFDEKKPAWLTYSRKQNSLYAYYRDTSETIQYAQAINLANGSVTQIELTDITDDAADAVDPVSIAAIEGSSQQETFVSHNPGNGDSDKVLTARLAVNEPIVGNDRIVDLDDEYYWAADGELGELFITAEGEKSSLKHLIAETYTAATKGANSDRPYLVAEVKSIEDSDYATSGDSVGTATMTTSALTGSGTAWSTTIAGPAAGSTVQECDGVTTDFTSAWQASQVRWYLDSTLQVSGTDYTTSGTTVSFTTAPGATKTLYGYCENYPEVKVKLPCIRQ